MITDRLRLGSLTRLRPGGFFRFYFAEIVTALAAVQLLFMMYDIILHTRSLKYLVANIAVAAVCVCVLAVRGNHTILLYLAGMSLPLYLEVILLDRGPRVAITGTFLSIAFMGVSGLCTGTIPRDRFDFSPTVFFAGLFYIAAGFLSLVNSTDETASLVAIGMEAEMLLIFLLLTNAIRNLPQLTVFLRGFYTGFLLECIFFVIQYTTGFTFDLVGNSSAGGTTNLEDGSLRYFRGTLGAGPIVVGMYFGVMTLTMIGVYLCRKKINVGLYPIVGVLLGGGCLILSAKRSPWGGFAIGLLTMGCLLLVYSRDALVKAVRVAVVMVLPFMVLLPIIIIRAGANHEGAYEERVRLMRIAWRMHEAYPWVGAGMGTYAEVKRLFLWEGYVGWVYTVHNRYLMILAETGFVGATGLLLTYIMVLRLAFKGIRNVVPEYRPFQIALVAALVDIHWQMLWEICDGRQANYIYWFPAILSVVVPHVLNKEALQEGSTLVPSVTAAAR